MKRSTVRLLALACLVSLSLAAPAQEAVMRLSKPPALGTPSRPSVRFTHENHFSLEGVSCLACHHEIAPGKNDRGPKLPAAGGDPSVPCESCHTSARSLQNAFHENCITCHDREKSAGRVTGPRLCGECHVWGS